MGDSQGAAWRRSRFTAAAGTFLPEERMPSWPPRLPAPSPALLPHAAMAEGGLPAGGNERRKSALG